MIDNEVSGSEREERERNPVQNVPRRTEIEAGIRDLCERDVRVAAGDGDIRVACLRLALVVGDRQRVGA